MASQLHIEYIIHIEYITCLRVRGKAIQLATIFINVKAAAEARVVSQGRARSIKV